MKCKITSNHAIFAAGDVEVMVAPADYWTPAPKGDFCVGVYRGPVLISLQGTTAAELFRVLEDKLTNVATIATGPTED